jgi:hypothetical protein
LKADVGCLQAGFFRYLTKPVKINVFMAAFDPVLGRAS